MYLFPRVVLLFIFYPTKNHEKKKNNPKYKRDTHYKSSQDCPS